MHQHRHALPLGNASTSLRMAASRSDAADSCSAVNPSVGDVGRPPGLIVRLI